MQDDSPSDYISDIEAALLGSILIDPDCVPHVLPLMRPSFFDGKHADIVEAMLDLYEQRCPIDYVTVCTLMDERGQMDLDRQVYIEQLSNRVIISAHASFYVRKVAENAQKRDRIRATMAYAAALQRGDPNTVRADEDTYRAQMAEIDGYIGQESHLKPFKTIFDAFNLPPLQWLIDGVLPAQSTAALVADGGVGKSFLALDWALRIAAGIDWQGRKVMQGHVYYMVGEGVGDIQYRILAWCQHQNIEPADLLPFFHWDDEPTPLLNSAQVTLWLQRLSLLIPAGKLRYVVIDTLSCVTPGANLNEPQTMSLAAEAARRASALTGATSLILHHTNANGGIRGSTALRDDVDCCLILMEDGEKVLTLTSERKHGGKMKYAEDFTPVTLKREKIWLNEALTLSSCVLVSTLAEIPSNNLAGNDLKMLKTLCSMFGEKTGATNAEWSALSGVPKGSQDRTIKRLLRNGYVEKMGEGVGAHYRSTDKGRGITEYHSVSNEYHDTDDIERKVVSLGITPLRGDTSDTTFSMHPIPADETIRLFGNTEATDPATHAHEAPPNEDIACHFCGALGTQYAPFNNGMQAVPVCEKHADLRQRMSDMVWDTGSQSILKAGKGDRRPHATLEQWLGELYKAKEAENKGYQKFLWSADTLRNINVREIRS